MNEKTYTTRIRNNFARMHKIIPLIALFLGFCLSSCHQNDKTDQEISGIIEYRIRYLNNNLTEKELSILPKTMKMVFNNQEAINYIDGFLGLYKLNTITRFDSRKCQTLLKVFDKHFLYNGKKLETMCCFDKMPGMQLRETNELKEIAGLPCKRFIANLPSGDSFDVYYTEELPLNNPNANNPYHRVNGILMQFQLQFLHLQMEFYAESYKPATGSTTALKIPANTAEVTKDQMMQILNRLME